MIRRWHSYRRRRAYERLRLNALVRASNGERIPQRERELLNLPDWTS